MSGPLPIALPVQPLLLSPEGLKCACAAFLYKDGGALNVGQGDGLAG